jgi:dTDP-glucose 4,6-dehydratase
MYVNKNHKFYPGDVCDSHFLDVVMDTERPDVVIHGADENSDDNNSVIRTNVLGTQSVIDSCKKRGVKMIYLSSDKVYCHSDTIHKENERLVPNSVYAASKASAEMLVHGSGINGAIIRPCNLYGPWQYHSDIIPKIIKGILGNEEFELENGMNAKEWLHVYDFCSIIFKVIDDDLTGIINATASQELSVLEVFHKLCNVLDKGYDLAKFQNNEINTRLVLNSTILKLLNWEPSFKFSDGIKHTAQWYVNNQWFFRL